MGKFYTLLETMISRINASVKHINGVTPNDDGGIRMNSVRNLLDNSNFANPVNQRNVSGSIADTGYFLDRWALDSGTVEIGTDGITLNGTINQILEHAPTKAVTAAASAGTATFDISTNTYSLTASGELITWAALYEGEYTTDTLPPYTPKGYSTELTECQRYYRVFDIYRPVYEGMTSTLIAFYVGLGMPMRVTPTFEMITAPTFFRYNGSGSESIVFSSIVINNYSEYNASLSLQITLKTGITDVAKTVLFSDRMRFSLSADL